MRCTFTNIQFKSIVGTVAITVSLTALAIGLLAQFHILQKVPMPATTGLITGGAVLGAATVVAAFIYQFKKKRDAHFVRLIEDPPAFSPQPQSQLNLKILQWNIGGLTQEFINGTGKKYDKPEIRNGEDAQRELSPLRNKMIKEAFDALHFDPSYLITLQETYDISTPQQIEAFKAILPPGWELVKFSKDPDPAILFHTSRFNLILEEGGEKSMGLIEYEGTGSVWVGLKDKITQEKLLVCSAHLQGCCIDGRQGLRDTKEGDTQLNRALQDLNTIALQFGCSITAFGTDANVPPNAEYYSSARLDIFIDHGYTLLERTKDKKEGKLGPVTCYNKSVNGFVQLDYVAVKAHPECRISLTRQDLPHQLRPGWPTVPESMKDNENPSDHAIYALSIEVSPSP